MKSTFLHLIQDVASSVQPDSTADNAVHTAYDSLWAGNGIPTQAPSGLEQVMLSDEKIFVVLAVVLIIWFGIILLIMRTDRHLKSVERSVEENIKFEKDDL